MNLRTRREVAVVAVLLFSPGALAGAAVGWDQDADFAKYKTFSWVEGTHDADPELEQRLERSIAAQLGARGLEQVNGGSELLVLFHGSVEQEMPVTADGFDHGGWPGWGGWSSWGGGKSRVDISEIPLGSLVVDLVDATTRKLVWRGVSDGAVKRDKANLERRIRKKLSKLFSKYPPPAEM